MFRFIFFLLPLAAFAQTRYDLLLKGGHVIDAKNHLSAVRDVAISHGRIAAVEPNLACDAPAYDAQGCLDRIITRLREIRDMLNGK